MYETTYTHPGRQLLHLNYLPVVQTCVSTLFIVLYSLLYFVPVARKPASAKTVCDSGESAGKSVNVLSRSDSVAYFLGKNT